MRYVINFDKTINQLTPHYIGGRKLILFLQSLMKPLQIINQEFVEYAKETRIETTMTSQIFKFEWYLNHKLHKYFLDGGQITIKNGAPLGIPIYHQNADVPKEDNLLLYQQTEGNKGTALYRSNEQTDKNTYSFIVNSPAIDTSLISEEQYLSMLKFYIDKYRLAGKTYVIKLNK